ncbi:MAG: hypothetical protein QOF14_4343 [Hyphomicrobiales bacterium]|jgi:hypothetical protein|nr:hypothetical protein [Hyphomicrobiales bacterium]
MMDLPINAVKADLISTATDRYGLKSTIDVGACWGVNGGYTFHALANGIERATILDGHITDLTRERASGKPNIELREGDLGSADFIAALPRADAAIIFDVLLHQVAPDWDEFLARYSRKVDHFIIYNQDWIGDDESIRFIDRGLDWYLKNVVGAGHERTREWFSRHNSFCSELGRPWRDVHMFWQWGIVDTELIGTMRRLGFKLDSFNNYGPWSPEYPKIQCDGYLFSRR